MITNTTRLHKILRELNISLEKAIEFLKSKGFEIESSPNTKVDDELYQMLTTQFQNHKYLITNKIENIESKSRDVFFRINIQNNKNNLSFNFDEFNDLDFNKLENIEEYICQLTNNIFSTLIKIEDLNTKYKTLGLKRKIFNYSIHYKSYISIEFVNKNNESEIIVENLSVNFKKLILMERTEKGEGIKSLNRLIFNTLSNNTTTEEIINTEKYNTDNPYQNDILEVLKNNYANGKIIKTVHYNNEILNSEFSDFQAFHICKGLKNQLHLYNKFVNNNHSTEDVFLAHNLANKLLKEKGKKMIDYILSLPSLPIKTDQFKILFSTLDKIRIDGKNDNPIIRLNIPNEEGTDDEVEFSFYSIDGKKYINQIITKNKTKKTDAFSVTRNGVVLPKDNNAPSGKNLNITPVLQFFYHISKSTENLNQAVISYGLTSGKCSVCGRKLEEEKSILKGIGPVCVRYIEI